MQTLPLIRGTRFGDMEIPESGRYRLLRPLAGFPATRHLVKVSLPKQAPFVWLQSVEEAAVAFAAVPVTHFWPEYALEPAPWDKELWGSADAEVLVLMSFQGAATANLAAPVMVDPSRRLALQTLNQSGGWGMTQSLPRR